MINNMETAILMATYNGEKFISAQLDSILAQTDGDWSLYIRDDGSTDSTMDIVKRYMEKSGNIHVIEDGGEKLGCSKNFFRLLETVESEYYMFCDQDDIWMPDKIEVMKSEMKKLEEGGKPAVVHCDFSMIDENSETIKPSYWKHIGLTPEKCYSPDMICVATPVRGASMMFDRKVRDAVVPYMENALIYDNYITYLAAKKGCEFKPVHRQLDCYRVHPGNISGFKVKEKKTARSVIKGNIGRYRELKSAGYRPFVKYLYYKTKFLRMRHVRTVEDNKAD